MQPCNRIYTYCYTNLYLLQYVNQRLQIQSSCWWAVCRSKHASLQWTVE